MMQTRYRMLCCMYISAMQHHCCNGLFAWTSVDCKHDWWPRRRRGWVGILWAAHLPLSLLLRRLAVPRWASWDLTAWLIIQPLEVIAYVFKVQYAACSTVLLVPVWFSIKNSIASKCLVTYEKCMWPTNKPSQNRINTAYWHMIMQEDALDHRSFKVNLIYSWVRQKMSGRLSPLFSTWKSKGQWNMYSDWAMHTVWQ